MAERLAKHGFRFTLSRRAIVETLSQVPGPRSAAEIAGAMEHPVPVSSLYRNLGLLEEAGITAPHHGADGLTRYELSEAISGHHHHLVCTRCGLVDDVELGPEREAALDSLAQSAGAANGFQPESHSLEIEGVCQTCAGPVGS